MEFGRGNLKWLCPECSSRMQLSGGGVISFLVLSLAGEDTHPILSPLRTFEAIVCIFNWLKASRCSPPDARGGGNSVCSHWLA